MKAYHFVPASYGIQNLARRRLKIATIPDLNDPFELLCVDLSNQDLRSRMREWKAHMGRSYGMLCFSKTWHNPVQWSHYADRHKGLALAFKISPKHIHEVAYSEQRTADEAKKLLKDGVADEEMVFRFLTTKYAHWQYEQELRMFTRLVEHEPESGLYFHEFSDDMKLFEVIIGAESKISREQVTASLGDLAKSVSIRNARLAFKKYEVTTQNDHTLWT